MSRPVQSEFWRISTRAPREGSDGIALANALQVLISTRAPREGSDR